jgi:hypothetical protein
MQGGTAIKDTHGLARRGGTSHASRERPSRRQSARLTLAKFHLAGAKFGKNLRKFGDFLRIFCIFFAATANFFAVAGEKF